MDPTHKQDDEEEDVGHDEEEDVGRDVDYDIGHGPRLPAAVVKAPVLVPEIGSGTEPA